MNADLASQLKKTAENLVEKSSTGEKCSIHEDTNMLLYEGEVNCPRCETERWTRELSEESSRRIHESLRLKHYRVLKNRSIISDNTILDATFGNFETPTNKEVAAKAEAANVFKKLKDGNKVNGWFVGEVGTGKSHLSMAILKNINEIEPKDKSCLFISVERMFMLIRDSYKSDSIYTEFYFIDLLSKVDYLVLDDLGAETGAIGNIDKASNFIHRILYSITNARMDKSTIITTNMTKRELISVYDEKTISRLSSDYAVVKFEGMDDKRGDW